MKHLPFATALTLATALLATPVMASAPAAEDKATVEPPAQATDFDPALIEPMLENILPRHVVTRGWEKIDGAEVRYAATRGPIEVQLQGDLMITDVRVSYWVEAHKNIMFFMNMGGRCGTNAYPQEMKIRVLTRYLVTDDMVLYANSNVLPPKFKTPCIISQHGINITPQIANFVQGSIQKMVSRNLPEGVPLVDIMGPQSSQSSQSPATQPQQPRQAQSLRPKGMHLQPR